MLHSRTAAQHSGLKFLGMMALLSLTLIAIGSAKAHQKGDFIVRLGVTGTDITKGKIEDEIITQNPVVIGNETVTFIERDLYTYKNDTAPAISATWMVSDYIGLDMEAVLYKNDVRYQYITDLPADRQDPVGLLYHGKNFLDVRQAQAALGLVYYPLGNMFQDNILSRIHPYIGLGASYTETTSKLHRDWIDTGSNRIDALLAAGTITAAQAESDRQELAQDAAIRIHDSNWKVTAKIGADFSLTKHFLLNAQARYTRMNPNVAYWSYMLGFGIKI